MDKSYTYYYFIGIGGIGMSALARYFNAENAKVYGYDRVPGSITDALQKEGILIDFEDKADVIPAEIRDNKAQTLVVYTPAIPQDNALLDFFKNQGYSLKKRSEVLGDLTDKSTNLSVAGTHGKTTTSCMLASIFKASDKKFDAFLGGISADLGSNYYKQDGNSEAFTITEADEFDRSFLQLKPQWSIITSCDADHLDIYGAGEEVLRSYAQFAEKVKDHAGLFVARNKTGNIQGEDYSAFDAEAVYYARIKENSSRGTYFDILEKGKLLIQDIYVNIPGDHNAENALAAVLLAIKADVPEEAIRKGLAGFKGIKRRFEYIIDKEDIIFIDDYAHHPNELNSIISSVKKLYPSKRITAIFQPHLYSRTRDFAEDFAKALSRVDELILLPVYPARELPVNGVESHIILDKVQLENKKIWQKEILLRDIDFRNIEILLTLGAGDIDRLIEPLKNKYYGKN